MADPEGEKEKNTSCELLIRFRECVWARERERKHILIMPLLNSGLAQAFKALTAIYLIVGELKEIKRLNRKKTSRKTSWSGKWANKPGAWEAFKTTPGKQLSQCFLQEAVAELWLAGCHTAVNHLTHVCVFALNCQHTLMAWFGELTAKYALSLSIRIYDAAGKGDPGRSQLYGGFSFLSFR